MSTMRITRLLTAKRCIPKSTIDLLLISEEGKTTDSEKKDLSPAQQRGWDSFKP